MKDKKRKLSTPGIIVTSTLYLFIFPGSLQKAMDTAGNLAHITDLFYLMFWVLLTLLILAFQFNHIDGYTHQRGEQFNIAGILAFFAITIILMGTVG